MPVYPDTRSEIEKRERAVDFALQIHSLRVNNYVPQVVTVTAEEVLKTAKEVYEWLSEAPQVPTTHHNPPSGVYIPAATGTYIFNSYSGPDPHSLTELFKKFFLEENKEKYDQFVKTEALSAFNEWLVSTGHVKIGLDLFIPLWNTYVV